MVKIRFDKSKVSKTRYREIRDNIYFLIGFLFGVSFIICIQGIIIMEILFMGIAFGIMSIDFILIKVLDLYEIEIEGGDKNGE